MLAIEKNAYKKNDLQGPSLITHIRKKNGLKYSYVAVGPKNTVVGYSVAIDDKMDDGRRCVYLDDIALLPQVQRRGIGWKLVEALVSKLHATAKKTKHSILFDMHLRPTSQRFMDKNAAKLAKLGTTVCEEEQYPGYYGTNQDALYRVYRVNSQ